MAKATQGSKGKYSSSSSSSSSDSDSSSSSSSSSDGSSSSSSSSSDDDRSLPPRRENSPKQKESNHHSTRPVQNGEYIEPPQKRHRRSPSLEHRHANGDKPRSREPSRHGREDGRDATRRDNEDRRNYPSRKRSYSPHKRQNSSRSHDRKNMDPPPRNRDPPRIKREEERAPRSRDGSFDHRERFVESRKRFHQERGDTRLQAGESRQNGFREPEGQRQRSWHAEGAAREQRGFDKREGRSNFDRRDPQANSQKGGKGDPPPSKEVWGVEGNRPPPPTEEKEVKPDFGLSGALADESNKVNGVVLLYQEPPEAANTNLRWRFYTFKGGELVGEPLYLHRQSCYLFGRERRVVDIPTDHPSCSKQHAVLQYRRTTKVDDEGLAQEAVRPFLMDLGSTNGTFINGERLEAQRFYEILEKDVIKTGHSSREYVLLHEGSLH